MYTLYKLHMNIQVECVDWTGGQIKNDDCSDDVKNVDLSQVHYLSGPVEIEGAKPGTSQHHHTACVYLFVILNFLSHIWHFYR